MHLMAENACHHNSGCHPVRVSTLGAMLGAKAIFLYSPFPPSVFRPYFLPHSTWMIGDSGHGGAAAASSDDGFITVIICKAAEYRTSDDDQD